jgi:hypothetical protein
MSTLLLVLNLLCWSSGGIEHNSIDGIYIGMPMEKFFSVIGNKYTIQNEKENLEGDYYDFYYVYNGVELLYSVEPDCEGSCNIWRITVYSDDSKTSAGIGVGRSSIIFSVKW